MGALFDYQEIKEYLQEVSDQIQYQPVREPIKKELADHLEDSICDQMENGSSQQDAVKNAVHAMGDGISVGLELNDTYRIQTDKRLNILIAILLTFGFICNIVSGNIRNIRIMPYIIGIAVLYWTVKSGYKILLQRRNYITKILILLAVIPMITKFLRFEICDIVDSLNIFLISPLISGIMYHAWLSTLFYPYLLFLLIFALFLYKGRHQGVKKIITAYTAIWIPALIWYLNSQNGRFATGMVILIIAAFITAMISTGKGFFSMKKRILIPVHLVCQMVWRG